MKVSRYAVLALATAVALGVAVSPVMAQNTPPPPQSGQDAMKSSSDAMKSNSDAMKSNSDAMKSNSDAMKSDANKSTEHHKKHKKNATEPAAASTSGH
ncbi:MAG TPA: hypothetical protein VFG49_10805 [Dyella sp.]|uniref:hypothetical protein n=1 Tax=Dyella sp. TaxID=1869338 RepID=UPI002D7671DC|nr:hypothetical protein [Dyella sp.]HET6554014.1 hypothetical protein [Dyella sp.]